MLNLRLSDLLFPEIIPIFNFIMAYFYSPKTQQTMKKTLFLLLVGVVALLTSCKETPAPQSSITGYDQEELTQILYADQTATQSDFSFTAAEHWDAFVTVASRADVDNSWLSVSPSSGEAGPAEMKISLTENYTGKDRSADIKIVSGSSVIILKVDQSAATQSGDTVRLDIVKNFRFTLDDSSNPTAFVDFYLKYGNNLSVEHIDIEASDEEKVPVPTPVAEIDFMYEPYSVSYDLLVLPARLTSLSADLNEAGLIESLDKSQYGDAIYHNTYNADGQLIKVVLIESNSELGTAGIVKPSSEEPDTSQVYEFIWENGNCIEFQETFNRETSSFVSEIEYTDMDNTMNINIFNVSGVTGNSSNFMFFPVSDYYLSMLGFNGMKSKKLPLRYTMMYETNSSIGSQTTTFAYTLTPEGEVSTIDIVSVEEVEVITASPEQMKASNSMTTNIKFDIVY